MNRFDKYDQNLIKNLVAESTSLTQVCEKLQISTGGYSTKNLREYLEEHNIDYSHFKQTKVPQTKEQYKDNPNLCKNCGKPLPWEKRRNNFCNHSCSAEYNNKLRECKPHTKSLLSSTTILDKISDENFIEIINSSTNWKEILEKIEYSRSSKENAKNKIRDKAQKLNISLNIRKAIIKKDWKQVTKGELFSYCKNWQSARTQIRKVAYKSFEEANRPYKCAICGYNKHIEIAHIKAVSDFDDNSTIAEINNSKNLVGLCPTHHWEFDNNAMDEENKKKLNEYINTLY